MRTVIQRVKKASVTVNDTNKEEIHKGYVLLLGIEDADEEEDVEWLSRKVSTLRIFNDSDGKMNLSINEVNGDVLVVSQFTLHAKTKKGTRPSYVRAAKPDRAVSLYKSFIRQLEKDIEGHVRTGEFGADMDVALINDGPVTILIDTKNKE